MGMKWIKRLGKWLTGVPYEEAAKVLQDKPAVTRQVFDDMMPDLQARAFTITGVDSADALQAARDAIAEIPRGADWRQTKKALVEKLKPWLGDGAEARVETLMRWHGFHAYSVANARNLDANSDLFPYREYRTAKDDKVRASHAALDGVVMPWDSPFWDRLGVDREFGCRCGFRGVTAEEAEELREEEADKPPGERKVLDGRERMELEQHGNLVRGDEVIDVKTAAQKGKGGPSWSTEDMRIPMELLERRYDTEVWAKFRNWAESIEIDGGAERGRFSLLDWWKGLAPAVPQAMERLQGVFRRVALPKKPLKAPRRKSPLSGKMKVAPELQTGTLPGYLDHARTLMDMAHDEGGLAPIAIVRDDDPHREASYDAGRNRIGIRIDTQFPISAAIHEVGHWIDHQGTGIERNGYRMAGSLRRDSWSQKLVNQLREMPTMRTLAKETSIDDVNKGYLLDQKEILARAYVQFVAARTGDKSLRDELANWRDSIPYMVFTKEEEKHILKAMSKGLKQLGWKI